jgi:hypothetical protein
MRCKTRTTTPIVTPIASAAQIKMLDVCSAAAIARAIPRGRRTSINPYGPHRASRIAALAKVKCEFGTRHQW